MGQVTIDRDAQLDMDEIWLYIARHNVQAADRILDLFLQRFRMLARQPLIGEPCEELLPSLRRFSAGRYVIFYFPAGNGVRIARVLHGARDVGSLFG